MSFIDFLPDAVCLLTRDDFTILSSNDSFRNIIGDSCVNSNFIERIIFADEQDRFKEAVNDSIAQSNEDSKPFIYPYGKCRTCIQNGNERTQLINMLWYISSAPDYLVLSGRSYQLYLIRYCIY